MQRVRVAASGWSGGPGLYTYYFVHSSEGSVSAQACVDGVRAALNSYGRPLFYQSTFLQVSGDVDIIDPATGAITNTISVTTPAVVGGSDTTAQGPPQVAGLLNLSTNNFIAGRRLRGRQFYSPLARGHIDTDGSPTTGCHLAIEDIATALVALASGGNVWSVWHRPVAGSGGQAAPIVSFNAPDKFATLNSRRD